VPANVQVREKTHLKRETDIAKAKRAVGDTKLSERLVEMPVLISLFTLIGLCVLTLGHSLTLLMQWGLAAM
jgi:hypothetical protein